MPTTAATPIVFNLSNKGTHDIDINYIVYEDNNNTVHVADYSGWGGYTSDSRNNTRETYNKRYLYGDYLEKDFLSDTRDRLPTYTTMTGVTLTVNNTTGIQSGWVASGNGLTGRSVVNVLSPTILTMSGTYSGTPVIGGTVTFSTSTDKITVANSDHLGIGWQIIQNGYELADNAVITAINGTTLTVNKLPNQSTVVVSNPMLFFTSTNYLTMNSTNNLDIGFTANYNGYNNSQSIIAVLGDGQTVQMSDQPGSTPVSNNEITFTSNKSLVNIPVGSQATFIINYNPSGSASAGSNYASTVTIYATQLPSTPIVAYIHNYITINNPPPPATPDYTVTVTSSGGGGGRPSYTVTTFSYSDGSTNTISVNNQTGDTSFSKTDASPGSEGSSDAGTTSVNTTQQSSPGGGNSSRVICTYFYRKGMMPKDVWRADMEYTFTYLSPATVRGYQYWAIPYVRLMRRSPLAEKIIYPLMMARAEELAYKMGVLEKGNWLGKFLRFFGEPVCFLIGVCVKEQDFNSLWNTTSDRKI